MWVVKVIEGLSSHNFGLHNGVLVPNGVYLTIACTCISGVDVAVVLSFACVSHCWVLICPKTNPALVAWLDLGRWAIGLMATVIKGPHRTCVGTIKDTNRPISWVKLQTGNKVTMINKEKLYRVSYLYIISFFFC
jgi:hypothetical protein